MAVNQIDNNDVLDALDVVHEMVLMEDVKDILKKVGRPSVPEDEEILSNGCSRKQWKWIMTEAKAKHIAAAQYKRFMLDCFIDSVEASRKGSPATKNDDKKYERLIKQSKSNKKSNHKIKRR